MFQTFFCAGFECTTGYNVHRQWIDQVAATQHDRFAWHDYRLLRDTGIRVAREGMRWPLIDRGGRYDFSTIEPFLAAGRAHEIDIIFDLFHFGYPSDVDPLSPQFADRFSAYCYAAAQYVAARSIEPPAFTPINEPSYFAWAAGDAALFAPHLQRHGWELKVALARAAIQGIDAIWSACPAAHIVNVDALCRVAAPVDRPDLQAEVDWFNETVVFQSWDMLCGRLLPELGGTQRHLGVVGVNYYWKNQWEWPDGSRELPTTDSRRWPVRALLRHVWERYGNAIMITETSHVGDSRAEWLRQVVGEARAALEEGVPLQGLCIYPVLGMPEWHDRDRWTQMGLWDLVLEGDMLCRVPHEPALEALANLTSDSTARPLATPKFPAAGSALWMGRPVQ